MKQKSSRPASKGATHQALTQRGTSVREATIKKRRGASAAKPRATPRGAPVAGAAETPSSSPGSSTLPRPRRAHGPPRPVYFGDPNLDRLVIVIVAMLGEISAVRERIDLHERLADQGRRAATHNVEKFRLEPAALAARSARETALIKRVLRVFFEEADEIGRARTAQGQRP